MTVLTLYGEGLYEPPVSELGSYFYLTLTIQAPEDTFVVIEEQAQHKGIHPEQRATEWITQAAQRVQPIAHDPLDDFVGSWESSVPDLAEHYHTFLGETI